MSNQFVVNNFYWKPIQEIIKTVEQFCLKNTFKNILEIGPGIIPFSLANKCIGFNETIKDYIELDIDINKLPYEDKEIDFIYSRHVLEDIQNPDFAMKEIIRVSKSGYIETPSPLIEITKGVDGGVNSNKYCGYIHHRYIIWSNIQKNEIYFLPKYSNIIENFLEIDQLNLEKCFNLINNYPIYWNNYFIWKDVKPTIIMYKIGVNIGLNGNLIKDYNKLINEAVNISIQNTDYFIQTYV